MTLPLMSRLENARLASTEKTPFSPMLFSLVLLWIICGLVAMSVADAKDCNCFNWLFGGLLFGPIAVIGAAGLPDKKLRRIMRLMAEAQGVDVDGREPNAPQGQPLIQ